MSVYYYHWIIIIIIIIIIIGSFLDFLNFLLTSSFASPLAFERTLCILHRVHRYYNATYWFRKLS